MAKRMLMVVLRVPLPTRVIAGDNPLSQEGHMQMSPCLSWYF